MSSSRQRHALDSRRARRTARLASLCAGVALGALLAALPGPCLAGDWFFSGYAEGELRIFPYEPAFDGQDDSTFSPSIAAAPEIAYEWNEGDDRITFVPFGRLDADDDHRTHWDIREANWTHVGSGYDIVLGVSRVFWGVTESRHLVDIINQRDLVEDVDEEDTLGQPMANLNLITDYGRFGFYVLPGFRERTFPDGDARLRGPVPIRTHDERYEADSDNHHVDFAFRYTNTIGPVDIGLSQFHGTTREPRLLPRVDGSGDPFLLPYYEIIDQTGLDLQGTFGPLLLKLEAMTRSGQGDRINAVVGGFEYTFFGALGETGDLGFLGEYLYDDRDFRSDPGGAPPTAFDNDVFVGSRLTFNDPQDTMILAGATVDTKDQGTFVSIEAQRRLGDRWRAMAEARGFLNVDEDDELFGVRRDDFLRLQLEYFF